MLWDIPEPYTDTDTCACQWHSHDYPDPGIHQNTGHLAHIVRKTKKRAECLQSPVERAYRELACIN